jgi:hypothetical protein
MLKYPKINYGICASCATRNDAVSRHLFSGYTPSPNKQTNKQTNKKKILESSSPELCQFELDMAQIIFSGRKGIQLCSNEGKYPSPMEDNSKGVKIH